MSATYTIKLPQFEGPFDLLLFFIERDELDIHDIPIAQITDEFLRYIRQMEALNIDLASEFILVAATLMRIKAKMLIPRKPIDEEGNEIDPREELVQRLLEYKRYKSVLEEMRTMEEDRSVRNERGGVTKELQQIATKALVDIELESLTLFKLLKAFERVLARQEDKKAKAIHRVYNYNYSIQGQQVWLLTRVRHGQRADFNTIFSGSKDRIHAIVTFLALLELLNMQKLHCIPGIGVNNFWLEVKEPDLEENTEAENEESAEISDSEQEDSSAFSDEEE